MITDKMDVLAVVSIDVAVCVRHETKMRPTTVRKSSEMKTTAAMSVAPHSTALGSKKTREYPYGTKNASNLTKESASQKTHKRYLFSLLIPFFGT